MKQQPRVYYTDSQKALMWERWKKGDSLQMIAQMFGRNHSSIQRILAETGGIRPAPRCRSRLALSLAEREEFPGVSLLANRFGRLRHIWVARHRLSAERSSAMGAMGPIAQT